MANWPTARFKHGSNNYTPYGQSNSNGSGPSTPSNNNGHTSNLAAEVETLKNVTSFLVNVVANNRYLEPTIKEYQNASVYDGYKCITGALKYGESCVRSRSQNWKKSKELAEKKEEELRSRRDNLLANQSQKRNNFPLLDDPHQDKMHSSKNVTVVRSVQPARSKHDHMVITARERKQKKSAPRTKKMHRNKARSRSRSRSPRRPEPLPRSRRSRTRTPSTTDRSYLSERSRSRSPRRERRSWRRGYEDHDEERSEFESTAEFSAEEGEGQDQEIEVESLR